jgi:hypothetical protein
MAANRLVLPVLPALILLAVAACATAQSEPWARPDGTAPPVTEVGDCHFEARRQAIVRYPDQPRREERGIPAIEDERRFPAEIRFFEQCMTRKGYARVVAPAK